MPAQSLGHTDQYVCPNTGVLMWEKMADYHLEKHVHVIHIGTEGARVVVGMLRAGGPRSSHQQYNEESFCSREPESEIGQDGHESHRRNGRRKDSLV